MKKNQEKRRARNPFYNHPLMTKGGIHRKSNKALRKSERQKLNKNMYE